MPPPSSPPEFSGNQVPDNDQNHAGGEPDAIDQKLEELKQLHQAENPAPADPVTDVGSVSKNRRFATNIAVIIAAIFLIVGGAVAAELISTGSKTQSPVKPGIVEPLNETVVQPSSPLPPESLSVTTLLAQAASISALNVSGSASIQGNLSVNGQGTFGGTIQAADFQGSGAGLAGVNAALLGGHPASFFTGLANSLSGAALLSGNNTFTGANTFISALSAGSLNSNSVTAGSLTSLGTITANSMTLGQPLSVTNGGIGLTNVPMEAILYGQGGATLGVATPSSAGLCLLSGTNSDTWGSCSGAIPGVATLDNLSGLLTIADSTGAGTTVTINDASTTQKGIAQFNATDFQAVGGVIDTSQSIAVTAAPSFSGLTLNNTAGVNNSPLVVANSDSTAGIQFRTGGSGSYDTYLGVNSGQDNNLNTGSQLGMFNTALGYDTLEYNGGGGMTGEGNTALGMSALQNNQTGNYNIGVGENSLDNNQNGTGNIAMGFDTMEDVGITGASANYNIGIGYANMANLTTGSNNIALGYTSGGQNVSGSDNTFVGNSSGNLDTDGFFSGSSLQNATAIGYDSEVQASNSLVLGSAAASQSTNVGIGTTIPLNTFSVSPVYYHAGNAEVTSIGTTVTGTGTTWTNAMIGMEFIFNTGQEGIITNVTSNTSLTLSNSLGVITPSENYRIQSIGFQVTNAGNADVQNTSATAFQVQNSAGSVLLNADTSNSRISIGSIGTPVGQLYVSGDLPSAPIGTYGSGNFFNGKLAVVGNYAYIAEYGSNHIWVLDVSNPASPSVISNTALGDGNPNDIVVEGHYAYITSNNATGNNFEIVDISDPTTPSLDARFNLPGSQQTGPLVVQGKYAFIEWNDNSSNDYLSAIDISNPNAPTLASTYHLTTSLVTVGYASGMTISGKYLYITYDQTSGTGLQIFNITNPHGLVSVGSLAIGTVGSGLYDPVAITVVGNYAYIADTNANPSTGQVVDVADPTTPTVAGTFAGGNGPIDIAAEGNQLYIDDYGSSIIQVDDITNPTASSTLGTIPGVPNDNSIFLQGRYLYQIGYSHTPNFAIDDLGGTYSQQLQAGAVQTGDLSVSGSSQLNGNLSVLGGVSSGGSVNIQGDEGLAGNLSVYGSLVQQDTTASTTAFQIQSASETVLDVDTVNNRVGIGTTAPTAPLDVLGQGSTNLTFATVIRNANGNPIAKFRNDGAVDLGQSAGSTFGDTTVEGTLDAGANSVVSADRFITPNAGANVTSMSLYIGAADPTPANDDYKLGIYSDNNGSPGSLVASSAQGSLVGNSWNTLPVTATLTGNTYYWLAAISNGSGANYNDPVYAISTTPTHAYLTNTYTSGFPANMTGATVNDYYHSIYATTSNGYVAGLTVGSNGNVGIGTGDTTPPAANLTVQTQANNTAAFQVQNSSGVSAFNVDTQNNITDIPSSIASTGTAQFQNGTNSTAAFKIQDTLSDTLFNVDTSNVAVTIGQSTNTLGYTTIGGSNSGSTNNHMNARKITTTAAGNLVSVETYFTNSDAAPNNKYQVALYSDSSGAPGSLLASSASDNTISPGAWNVAPLSYSLSAATSYWLVVNDNSTSNLLGEIAFDALGTDNYASIAQTYGTWPSSFGTPTTSNTNSESLYGNIDYGAVASTTKTGNFNVLKNLDTSTATGLAIGNNNATSISLGNTTNNIQTTINGTELVKPTSGHDSATAFQVNSAGGANLLTVDSTGSHVIVGGTAVCSGVPSYGRFCVGTNLTGVGAGSTNVNANNVTTTSLTSGSAETIISQKAIQTDTSSNTLANTLQGFVFDASGTTDTADSITAIQAIDPAANSGNLLNLQSCSGGSCATNATVARISNTGATTFENQANSAAAFQIQATGAANMFSVDTSADHIVIGSGSTGEASPVLLVLDSGTSASDPTGVAGAMYYNSSLNRFRCYENSQWKDCIGIDEDNQRQSPNESTDFIGPGNNGTAPWSLISVPTGSGGTFGHVTGVANHPGIVFLGSLAANGPNTGYAVTNYTISATGIDTIAISGGESWELVFSPSTLDANTTSYMGFIDNNTGVAPTNGIYLSLSNTTMTGVGVSGGTSTLTGTTDTLTTGHWYRARVVVNPSATAATFTVTDLTTSTTWTDSVSSHIPSLVGDGVESTYATAATHQLLSLDYMAFWYTGVTLNR